MTVRPDTAHRRSFADAAPGGAAAVFTQGFLNASLLQLAICAPPRQAATTREYAEIYITELGGKAPRKVEQKQFETVAAP